ncbi:MAG: ATP-binding cassette domain-containing protein [bacterium]
MIRFKDVSKKYAPDIQALDKVSFDINDGEFVFIVGPSGVGKSTIARLLLRTEIPSGGTITFNNIEVTKMKPGMVPAYRQQFGIVFQDDKLLETKTVRENIEFALEITGKNDKEIKETTDYLLEVTGLTQRANLFPEQLSGGEKQKAGIARALANDPKVFVADEPTGDLDPDNGEEILGIMEKINKWGTTVIVATHNKDIVNRKQTRVIRLENGKIISDCKGGYGKASVKCKKPQELNKVKDVKSKEVKPKAALEGLELDTRIKNILIKNKVDSTDKLLDMTEDELKSIKGITKKNVDAIIKSLKIIVKK